MKRLVLAASIVMSGSALANNVDENITVYNFGACNWWQYNSGSNGSGYVCSNYPTNVQVPDARDMVNVLNNMIEKIDALEARVKALEEAAKPKK